ncbi:hypothetical protein DL769_003498 [Monosporascus sp. CRB-8-3]|nr:hypothetical protein DL769_003498 [Monosporascus sp. CRB-8-3]
MRLLDLAPELVHRIFEAFACSRDFKRVMRLRLVSRQFKRFIDDAIFRLRLLDAAFKANRTPIIRIDSQYRYLHWRAFVLEYLAYQAWVEKEPASVLGRIRCAAVTLSEQIGETGRDQIMACLESLCRLACDNNFRPGHKEALFRSGTQPSPAEFSDEELEADLCVAAIYLGHRAHIEKLISKGWQFCAWGKVKDVVSNVFGSAYGAASFKGDVFMLRLLLSSDPNYNPSEPPQPSFQLDVLRAAAKLGHKDTFDFALDCRDLHMVGPDGGSRLWEYRSLREAIHSTPIPDNYRRGAAIFSHNSKVLSLPGTGSLLGQLAARAAAGQVDMVQYFLSQGVSPNDEESRATGTRSGGKTYQPLLDAVKGRNPDVVRLLLHHGANPNCSPVSDTALTAAARGSAISIAKMLLAAGASPDEGRPPPIVMAVFKEDMDMFSLLREYGARLDTPETGGWAMAVAQFYELESMVGVLVQYGVEKDAILRRCAERDEWYKNTWHLLPRCLLETEEEWWNVVYVVEND